MIAMRWGTASCRGSRFAWAPLCVALLGTAIVLATPVWAGAATGELDYSGCTTGETQSGPTGTNACAQIPSAASLGNNSGLDLPRGVVVSPDGESLYSVSEIDDAIARFSRNPQTGALTYAGCITGETGSGPTGSNACAQIPSAAVNGTNSGLDAPANVAVSPDGESIYVTAVGDDAITRFERNPETGALAYAGCTTGETESGPTGTNACAQIPSAAATGASSGLDSPANVAVSPDGESVYVTAFSDDAIAHFDRNPGTGALTYAGCITGETQSGPTGTNACAQIPSAASLGNNSGLESPLAAAVSPDGQSLYAVSSGDDAIARFNRTPGTGALTYVGCITGESDSGPTGSNACPVIPSAAPSGVNSGLDFPQGVAISPDGESLYSTAENDNAIARFDRTPGTGALTYAGCTTGETESGPTGSNACAQIPSAAAGGANSGLDFTRGVAISPDGESLYTGGVGDDAIAQFDRNQATGALTYAGCITGRTQTGPTGSNACAVIPGAVQSGTDSGLDALHGVAVSPDGKSLYTTAFSDDAIARFRRTIPLEPSVSVSDVTLAEGNAGQTQAEFEVTLSNGSADVVQVEARTENGTAVAPDDYASKTETLTFAPGDLSATFSVSVNGDTTFELNDTFLVRLGDAEGAELGEDGLGTIQNDDPAPDPGRCRASVATITGTSGDDVIAGTPGDDVIIAGSGDDVVSGAGGNDVICGGGGEDTINGNGNDDTLVGGSGSDAIAGNDGEDTVFGSEGDDVINGDAGNDTLRGQSGDDTISSDTGADTVVGASGDDILDGGTDDDTLVGSSGDDQIEGEGGADLIRGGSGDDIVNAGGGNDSLSGGGDDDTLRGEGDDDDLNGKSGDDELNGGTGTDTCDGGSGTNSQASC